MNSRNLLRLLAIVLVVIIALAVRLRAVEMLPIDYDEDDYLRAAQQFASAIQAGDWGAFTQLNYRTEHPPLTKVVDGIAIAPLPAAPEISDRPTTAPPAASLPQPHLTIARWVNATEGVLEVLVLALLNPLAALFLAVNTWQIKYTSQVMLEALPSCTSLLCVVAYSKSNGKINRWLMLSAIALGLTAASKYPYCLIVVAILIHWWWQKSRKDSKRRMFTNMAFWGIVALVVFFLADPYLWPDPINRLQSSVFYHAGYAESQHVKEAGYPMWQPLVWLAGPVPWHPGVFLVALDLVFTVLAFFGLQRAWKKYPVYVLWFGIMLGFLLVWPTKWPQYILMLTAPLSLVAAEGFQSLVGEPLVDWFQRVRAKGIQFKQPRVEWQDTRRAVPWLLPGLIALGLITVFPLVFQSAMALTDFSALSIRDGINGGVWREAWLGLTGQVKPVIVSLSPNGRISVQVQREDRGEIHVVPITESPMSTKEVHYAGPGLFVDLLTGFASTLLVFELIWTTLVLGLQTVLGFIVALLLNRRGVRFRGFWRAVYILPWAIPEFVGAMIWLHLFEPNNGWIALALGKPLLWRADSFETLMVMVLGAVWLGWPIMMIAVTAALQLIPHDVYDAANVDGANRWEQFRYITLPLVWPLLAPALIIRAIFTFNQFYLFYVMGAPWPVVTFSTISFLLFNTNGYFGGQFALSAVINMLTVFLLIVLMVWFTQRTRATEGVTYA